MPDVWLPGVHIDRGTNAGYNAGRSTMERAVAHYTVGSDSRNVGRDGYFHWLVHRDASRENGCTQYAEVDAVTWHAGNVGNPYGPGIEWERLTTGGMNDEGLSNAQPLTQNQIEWGARIVDFCAEWGIPVDLYDGPRYGQAGFRGWINHQAIDSQRSDGLLRAEWDEITGGDVDEATLRRVVSEEFDRRASWWQDITANVLRATLGDAPWNAGTLGQWEWDTRSFVHDEADRVITSLGGTLGRGSEPPPVEAHGDPVDVEVDAPADYERR